MIRSERKPISGEEPPARTLTELPNELLIEILSRLPGKQIGRCKCVWKPWDSIIRSRSFQDVYRKRQCGLLLYWPEGFKRDETYYVRFRFFHCPLRRSAEPLQEFSPLSELEIEKGDEKGMLLQGVTQFVNGLVCVGEDDVWSSDQRLTLHNICTGEKMRIPDPLPCIDTHSTFHLGYDPVRRVYKLLRMIFSFSEYSLQGAHIMNLRPPSDSPSTWRELDVADIRDLHVLITGCLSQEITRPDDGLLCWMSVYASQGLDLLCFDLSKESFRWVQHPVTGPLSNWVDFYSLTRTITLFDNRVAIWFSPSENDNSGISCYLQEDDEGKKWSTHHIDFSKEFKGFAVESRNLPSFSFSAEILLKNPDQSWRVYPYSPRCLHPHHSEKDHVRFVGEFPDGAPCLCHIGSSQCWDNFCPCSLSSVFSFFESNNLYQPLNDVLAAGSATT